VNQEEIEQRLWQNLQKWSLQKRTKLYNNDCLKVLPTLESKSVDLVLTDPPYGTTACKWDSIIPFDLMWKELKRIIKNKGCIALFGSEPFSSCLRTSNIKWFKYDWIWFKSIKTGFQLANKRPLKQHEIVSIFSKTQSNYNPQNLKIYNKINKRGNIGKNWSKLKLDNYIQHFTNYPSSVLKFDSLGKKYHSTQKPVALLEYLIKTYTKENDTVLDFTMGSGSTGVACKKLNRNFIGIEFDKNYFEIAKNRINENNNSL